MYKITIEYDRYVVWHWEVPWYNIWFKEWIKQCSFRTKEEAESAIELLKKRY